MPRQLSHCKERWFPSRPDIRADRPVRFEQISIADSLPESAVRAVLQDGFIWFATDDGLNR